MPDVKTIQDQIRARLAEVERLLEPLRLEAEQLNALAASFDAHTAKAKLPAASPTRSRAKTAKAMSKSPKTPPSPSTTARPKRGRPAGSGNRARQAVAKIIEQPGITASELAQAMGINANYLYRVLPQLEKDAKVIKRGKGYHPAGDAQATAPTNGQPVNA